LSQPHSQSPTDAARPVSRNRLAVRRLRLSPLCQLDQGRDVRVVHRAMKIDCLVDPHAAALTKQLLGSDRRTELAGLLRRAAVLIKAPLTPCRRPFRANLGQLLPDRGSDLRVPYVVMALKPEPVSRAAVPGTPGGLSAVSQGNVLLDERKLLS